jgi:hypothetical protein
MVTELLNFGPIGWILALAFVTISGILVLRGKYSKGNLDNTENEAKSTFIKELLAELQAVKSAANIEIDKARKEAHEAREKWNASAVQAATYTAVNSGLASQNAELVSQTRRLGHANQNLKQLLVLYAPDRVKDKILNSNYGVFDYDDASIDSQGDIT